MFSIKKCPVPLNTFLHSYGANGAYADCYSTEIPYQRSFPEFIFAFYTTPLFKLERFLLTWIVSKPSTDEQVRELADCKIESFAAWRVENRSENEILMCDYQGRTRSWLMAVPVGDTHTRLYFGSAVVPIRNLKTGARSFGVVFQALLGFHRVYSLLLLYSARMNITAHRLKKTESEQERV
jgi:hypothetical protein